MTILKNIILFAFLTITINIFSQRVDTTSISSRNWFVNIDLGVQMSGIKSEDFVSSNYSPLYRITAGKWLNKSLGIQFGYQGRYFNAIADNDKHFYDFYFLEGILDVKNFLTTNKIQSRKHELLLHGGVGFFQNRYYRNSSIHYVLGLSNLFSISKKITLKFDVGAIIGWDIYQGDEDILPSISLGIVYPFK